MTLQGAPRAVRERDLRGTGWWLLEQVTGNDAFDERRASVGAALLRVLSVLGPEPQAEDAALAETELRGRVIYGQPPRTPAEWERAARAFSPDALEEFQRWESGELLKRDRVGEHHPLV